MNGQLAAPKLPDLKLKSTQPNLRRHAFCQSDIGCGSSASYDASGGDFRYYPERRHSLALQQVTLRADCVAKVVLH